MPSYQRNAKYFAPLLAVALLCVEVAARDDLNMKEVVAPPRLDDGWEVLDIALDVFEEDAMIQLAESLDKGEYENVHAVLIEHDGKLVYEQYLSGIVERWGTPLGRIDFNRQMLHDLRSVTKSVTSILFGIAVGTDYEEILERFIFDYFPERKSKADPRAHAITLRHVLTMTAGLSWNEMTVPYTDWNNDELRLSSSDDPLGFVLSRTMREAPGERWYYNGGLSMVAGGLIQEIAGRPFLEYALEVLFEPLG